MLERLLLLLATLLLISGGWFCGGDEFAADDDVLATGDAEPDETDDELWPLLGLEAFV